MSQDSIEQIFKSSTQDSAEKLSEQIHGRTFDPTFSTTKVHRPVEKKESVR